MTFDLILFIAVTCVFTTTLKFPNTVHYKTLEDKIVEAPVKRDSEDPCENRYALFDGNYKYCYTLLHPKQIPTWEEDRCLPMKNLERFLHDAKIPSRTAFYKIFSTLQRDYPDVADGSVEILIGITYRRGDGFRWTDGSNPNDLSFLKFNPLDNLDDEDSSSNGYCLRFTIKVDKEAYDGYATNWYECSGNGSIETANKLFYVLCSYQEDRRVLRVTNRAKQERCRRNEISVRINNLDLCYVHVVGIYPTDDMTYSDIDTCRLYSKEYGREVERKRELSPASVPTRNLLRLLQKEILNVHRQFNNRTHGLMIGLMYMFHEYQWKDEVTAIHPTLYTLITGIDEEEECYRFMLFKSVPEYIVPVPCNNKEITYDILCKYVLGKVSNATKVQMLMEIKRLIEREPEEAFARYGNFCDNGYEKKKIKGDNYCYKMNLINALQNEEQRDLRNIATADEKFCRHNTLISSSMTSITIRNDEEFDFIKQLYQSFDENEHVARGIPLLIGLQQKDGVFRWMDGSPFDYSGFLDIGHSSHFAQFTKGDCRRIFLYSPPTLNISYFYIFDVDCAAQFVQYYVLCRYLLYPPTTTTQLATTTRKQETIIKDQIFKARTYQDRSNVAADKQAKKRNAASYDHYNAFWKALVSSQVALFMFQL